MILGAENTAVSKIKSPSSENLHLIQGDKQYTNKLVNKYDISECNKYYGKIK